jgi:MoaA/NifB/PqqE/SkfB family radical SAM enzyme
MRSIEVILDYTCNARCVFCFPPAAGPRSFTTNEVHRVLAQAYAQGARELYIGGGEPTLRKDLESLIRFAKEVGFQKCNLKTNGMLLCYPSAIDRYLAAGVDVFMLPVWGDAACHDSFAQVEGAYEKMEIAVKNIVDSHALVQLDLLMMRSTLPFLLPTIDHFVEVGVSTFSLWYLSLYGVTPQGYALQEELPTYAESAPVVRSILSVARKFQDREILISDFDLPPCIDIGTRKRTYVGSKDICIIYPGGSKIVMFGGGYKLPTCARCKMNKKCVGVRKDYIDVHGVSEFVPLR